MQAETSVARTATSVRGAASGQSGGSVGNGIPNGNGGIESESPIRQFMKRSSDSQDGHPMRGSSPADINPRFADDPANLEAIRIATLRQRAATQERPKAALIRCVDCGHRIPSARINAVAEYGIPKRCIHDQTKREKQFPRDPDSYHR